MLAVGGKHRKQQLLPLSSPTSTGSLGGVTKRRRRDPFSRYLGYALAAVFIVTVYTTHLVSPCYIGWLWHYRNRCLAGQPHPWQATPSSYRRMLANRDPSAPPPPKIAIAMIADNFMQRDIRNLTIRNKERYARTWGYDLFVPNHDELAKMARGLPVAWAKFPLIQRVLRTHEYVLVIDADAVILREDISLHKAAEMMGSSSLLISDDHNGPNSGVFMMRRSSWTTRFLNEAMKSAPLLSTRTRRYPLRFENRAFFYLLDKWPRCGPLRRVDAWLAPVFDKAPTFQKDVKTVDRCLINRRPARATSAKHLFDSGASHDVVDDAFVAHAAGGSIQSKIKALQWLLSVAPLS